MFAESRSLSVRTTSLQQLSADFRHHKSTAPLKDYYGKQGKLVTVEGQDKVEDTSKLVLEAVKA